MEQPQLHMIFPYVFVWSNDYVKEWVDGDTRTLGRVQNITELENIIKELVYEVIDIDILYKWNKHILDSSQMSIGEMKQYVVKKFYTFINRQAYNNSCFFDLYYFNCNTVCWKKYLYADSIIEEYVWMLFMERHECETKVQ